MKSPKHTKGPWKTEKTGLIYQESNNQGIARLVSSGTKQDAHLIAAAPEMYEAIEYILKEVTVLPGTGKQDGNIGHRHIDKLKDALKKARGES